MNETLGLIEQRFSCRRYTDEAVSPDQLAAIAAAGVQAPSASNTQPWRIVVVTNREVIAEVEAEALDTLELEDPAYVQRRRERNGGQIFFNAPAIIFVASEPDRSRFVAVDAGIVVENMVLAASALGLGTCVCGLAGAAFRGQGAQAMRDRLGFPPGFDFGISLIVGHGVESGTPHTPDQAKISYIA